MPFLLYPLVNSVQWEWLRYRVIEVFYLNNTIVLVLRQSAEN